MSTAQAAASLTDRARFEDRLTWPDTQDQFAGFVGAKGLSFFSKASVATRISVRSSAVIIRQANTARGACDFRSLRFACARSKKSSGSTAWQKGSSNATSRWQSECPE